MFSHWTLSPPLDEYFFIIWCKTAALPFINWDLLDTSQMLLMLLSGGIFLLSYESLIDRIQVDLLSPHSKPSFHPFIALTSVLPFLSPHQLSARALPPVSPSSSLIIGLMGSKQGHLFFPSVSPSLLSFWLIKRTEGTVHLCCGGLLPGHLLCSPGAVISMQKNHVCLMCLPLSPAFYSFSQWFFFSSVFLEVNVMAAWLTLMNYQEQN